MSQLEKNEVIDLYLSQNWGLFSRFDDSCYDPSFTLFFLSVADTVKLVEKSYYVEDLQKEINKYEPSWSITCYKSGYSAINTGMRNIHVNIESRRVCILGRFVSVSNFVQVEDFLKTYWEAIASDTNMISYDSWESVYGCRGIMPHKFPINFRTSYAQDYQDEIDACAKECEDNLLRLLKIA